jgi:DNA mismatch endonuclease (patch repair protein)
MKRVRRANTTPELAVRKVLHAAGFRYRLHPGGMPGRPDLILPKYRIVVRVNGCFWHRHPGCSKASTPKSRPDFWAEKFRQNVSRDARIEAELEALGWRVVTVWECQTRDAKMLSKALQPVLRAKSDDGVAKV